MGTRHHPTSAQTVKVCSLLAAQIIPAEGQFLSSYREGWSDARVAKETGAPVATVQRLRVGGYGELRRAALTTAGKSSNSARLDRLESAFNKLAAEIGSDIRVSRKKITEDGPEEGGGALPLG